MTQQARIDSNLRRIFQESDKSIRELARIHGVNPKTVHKWRQRHSAQSNRGFADHVVIAEPDDIPSFPDVPMPEAPVNMDAMATRAGAARKRIAALALPIAGSFFLKYGYEKTSMSAIFEEVGGSKSTFWKVFPSKRDLFEDFIRFSFEEYEKSIHLHLDVAVDIRSSMSAFVRDVVKYIYSDHAIKIYRMGLEANSHFRLAGLPIIRSCYQDNLNMLRTFMEHHITASNIVAQDVMEPLQFFECMCNGGDYHRALMGELSLSDEDMERKIAFILREFFHRFVPAR